MNHLSTLKAEELLLGEGWSTQEFYNDHSRRAYRWTSGGASELYVDTTVVNRIKIRGTLSGYVTENRSVTFVVDGQERPVQADVSANEQQFVVDMPNNPSQPVVEGGDEDRFLRSTPSCEKQRLPLPGNAGILVRVGLQGQHRPRGQHTP
jgi:hypothetical protein